MTFKPDSDIDFANRVVGELVQLRSDVLYLVRVIEKLEKKITQLESTVNQRRTQQQQDPLLGKIIEKL